MNNSNLNKACKWKKIAWTWAILTQVYGRRMLCKNFWLFQKIIFYLALSISLEYLLSVACKKTKGPLIFFSHQTPRLVKHGFDRLWFKYKAILKLFSFNAEGEGYENIFPRTLKYFWSIRKFPFREISLRRRQKVQVLDFWDKNDLQWRITRITSLLAFPRSQSMVLNYFLSSGTFLL